MKHYYITVIILLVGFSASSIGAEGLKIKPGLWEITTTTTNNMMGMSNTKSTQECIKNNEFDPVDDVQNDVCTTRKNISGNSMEYELSCNMHGRVIEGKGMVTVKGDVITDERLIENGAPGGISTKSESRRIGEC